MANSTRPSWWRRVFRRNRHDKRAERRVSALPPRLDLHLTTPMASRLDVNFATLSNIQDAETASLSDVPTAKSLPPTTITSSPSMPAAVGRDSIIAPADDVPPVPPVPAAFQPATTQGPRPASMMAAPTSPTSEAFTRKLQSTTRHSVLLTARTDDMTGYHVTTYVPSGSDGASDGETSESSKNHSSGDSGASHAIEQSSGYSAIAETEAPAPVVADTQTQTQSAVEAPVRASEESAFYSTHEHSLNDAEPEAQEPVIDEHVEQEHAVQEAVDEPAPQETRTRLRLSSVPSAVPEYTEVSVPAHEFSAQAEDDGTYDYSETQEGEDMYDYSETPEMGEDPPAEGYTYSTEDATAAHDQHGTFGRGGRQQRNASPW